MAERPIIIQEMLQTLESNPLIQGIIGRELHPGQWLIMVVVEKRLAQVESFFSTTGHVVVEWKIRTIGDLRRAFPLSDHDYLLLQGDVWYDPQGVCASLWRETTALWSAEGEELDPVEIQELRFRCTQPLLQLEAVVDQPPLGELLLQEAVTTMFQAYFLLHHIPYPGHAAAALVWKEKEPRLWLHLQHVYSTDSLLNRVDACRKLAGMVLDGLGGIWRAEEVLPSGLHGAVESLEREGSKVWDSLFEHREQQSAWSKAHER